MAPSRTLDALGNLGVAFIIAMVAAQAFRWLGSPPADASTLRYGLVVAQLILGGSLALGVAVVSLVRFRRAARE